MNRYITRRYVAIDWINAARLAKLDGTLLSEIRCCQNVALLHRTDWWAWWSDECLTTSIGLPDKLRPETLSSDAAALIFEVWIGGLIAPRCGWVLLTQVKRVLSSEVIYTNRGSHEATVSQWEKLTLLFDQGVRGSLYRHNYLNELGYQCDIALEQPLINCQDSRI
jgi:hypothetical protein